MVDRPRKLAAQVIKRFEQRRPADRLKADSLIEQAVHALKEPLGAQDRAFLQALVYGSLRYWFALDQEMAQVSGRPVQKLDAWVRALLRLGLFQLRHLSQVPDYAAINTTVDLAKEILKAGHPAVKLVNAALRNAQRQGNSPLPETQIWPTWWEERLQGQYSPAEIEAMRSAYLTEPDLSIRVNALKTSQEAYQQQLTGAGIAFKATDPAMPEMLQLPGYAGSPRNLPDFEQGLVYVQDCSSAWVSHLLAPCPGERVLDLCAAPGSKTTHLAALMQNQGQIVAVEPKKERLQRLKENLERLGVTCVGVEKAYAESYESEALFDRVLVDAPCSGTGTIRRHPEILLQLSADDFDAAAQLQVQLLTQGFALLKPGGRLVYSTCSIDAVENRQVIKQFLQATPEAKLLKEEQRLISHEADGFYGALLTKN